jgi:hypothetical protein
MFSLFGDAGKHASVPRKTVLVTLHHMAYGASANVPMTPQEAWVAWLLRGCIMLFPLFATPMRLLQGVQYVLALLSSVHSTSLPASAEHPRPPEDNDDPQRLATWRKWHALEYRFWAISALPMDALGTVLSYYPLAYCFGLPVPCTFKWAVLAVLAGSAVLVPCAKAAYHWLGFREWAQCALTKLILEAPADDAAATGEQQPPPSPACADADAAVYQENPPHLPTGH